MRVGINVTPLYSGHKLRGIGYYTKNLLDYLKQEKDIEISEFVKSAEIKNVELVHYPWFDFYFHTLPVIKRLPTIVTIHDAIPLIFKEKYPAGTRGRVNLYLQRLALSSCKAVITDSLSSKKDIVRHLGIPEAKVIAIPLAADSQFKVLKDTELLQTKRKYNLPDDFIMYTGDANWIKNLPFLIDGFRQLITIPRFKDVKLVLVGGVFLKNVESINHPELESLKILNRKIKEYQMGEKIIRPGNVADNVLVAFYNLATVYVQPSIYEGFGLPVLEAFACGASVISSNKGSLPEVGGKAALYFDPVNIHQLVALFSEVLQDKSLRYKLSKLGFEQAGKFSWAKTADQTKEVYKLVIKAANV